MATRPRLKPADKLIDDGLNELLAAYRGRWVALAPPSRFLGVGQTAIEAYSVGQAAGEPMPTVWRLPETETPAQ
jgi:hypothetical protein